MALTQSPCNGCMERFVGCHGRNPDGSSKCPRGLWEPFLALNQELLKEKYKENDVTGALIDGARQHVDAKVNKRNRKKLSQNHE